jgi:hypothetical protein
LAAKERIIMSSKVNVFNQAEVLFQEQEYFDAIVLESESSGLEVMIQQGNNCVNLHISCVKAFIESLRSVAAKGTAEAAKSAANK